MNCIGNGRGISRWAILCQPFAIPVALLTACAFVPIPASAAPVPAPIQCVPGRGFTGCMMFGYTGADQRFVVPEGVTGLSVWLWGAGGGGSAFGEGTRRGAGGAGGFTAGVVAVSGGELMTVTVGEGGATAAGPGYGGGGAGGSGAPGAGGGSGAPGAGGGSGAPGAGGGSGAPGAGGGSGGGMSALWDGASGSTALLVAGGGGGAAGQILGAAAGESARARGDLASAVPGSAVPGGAVPGGAGGGADGGTSGVPGSGLGATQIAGGDAGTAAVAADADQDACSSSPTAGIRFRGGNGASATGPAADQAGGGGGGGYYGGGGGTCQEQAGPTAAGSGGGGSGYVAGPGVTGVSVTGVPVTGVSATGVSSRAAAQPEATGATATSALPAGTTQPLYRPGTGVGGPSGAAGSADGGNGEVVIEWAMHVELSVAQSVTPSPFVPGRPVTYTLAVRNGGPAKAAGVRITDRLAAGLDRVTWRCSAAGAGSRCWHRSGSGRLRTRADIAAGGAVVYTIAGITTADAPDLSAAATVRPPRHTLDGGCEPGCHATTTAPARPRFALHVVRALRPGAIVPGTRVIYALTVRNGGPSDAFGARVAGPVPGWLRSVTWTCRSSVAPSRCHGSSGAGYIETTADIAAGGSVTYTVTGLVPGERARADDRAPVAQPPESAALRRAAERGCAGRCEPAEAAQPAFAQPVPDDYYLLDLAAVLWTLIMGTMVLLIRSTRRKAAARRR
jgi:uncharacterized repeat protein (TIGR01451 family)